MIRVLSALFALLALLGCANDFPTFPDAGTDDGGVDAGPPAVPAGSTCVVNGECGSRSFCLTEVGFDLPGGYCTTSCINEQDTFSCSAGSLCMPFGGAYSCVKSCTEDTDCREGYACVTSYLGRSIPLARKICAPGKRTAKAGDPCTKTSECPPGDGFCYSQAGALFPGGYCTVFCTPGSTDVCGPAAECVATTRFTTTLGGVCAARCSGGDCREGYSCAPTFGGTATTSNVCTPGTPLAQVGDACTTLGQCAPGVGSCRRGSPPGGYCTEPCDVGAASPCGDGAVCVGTGTSAFCAKSCAAPEDCRNGYSCVNGYEGTPSATPVCAPGTTDEVPLGHNCTTGSSCRAGMQYCLLPTDTFTNGYCSAPCNPRNAASCGAAGFCLGNSTTNPGSGFCLATCTTADDCAALRAPDTGTYGCGFRFGGASLNTATRVCVPYNPTAQIGDPCEILGDCTLGGFCLHDNAASVLRFTNGYCSDACDPSVPANTCGASARCLDIDPNNPRDGVCLSSCDAVSGGGCRAVEGYSCQPIIADGHSACFPQ